MPSTLTGRKEKEAERRLDRAVEAEAEGEADQGSILEIDPELEKRIVRKLDWHVLPWVCVAYFINYRECYPKKVWRF